MHRREVIGAGGLAGKVDPAAAGRFGQVLGGEAGALSGQIQVGVGAQGVRVGGPAGNLRAFFLI